MSGGALLAVSVPAWMLVAIGVALAALLVGGGLILWWPGHTRESWREVGLALVTGAVVAFGLFLLEALVQVDTRQKEQTRQERFQRDALRVALGQQPDLSGIGLVGLDLSRFYLRGKVLVGADLSRARLKGANLDEADLSGASLANADLTDSSLVRATLVNATLDGAHLESADLELARLMRASLSCTNLAREEGCTHLDRANLTQARLRAANLAGAYLSGAALVGARLRLANLHGARVDRGADLSYADLTGADLRGADLRGALVAPLDPTTGEERLDADGRPLVTTKFSNVLFDADTQWPDACPDGSWCLQERPRRRPAPELASFEKKLAGPEGRLPLGWLDRPGSPFGLEFVAPHEGEARLLVEGLCCHPPTLFSPRAAAASYFRTHCTLQQFKENYSGRATLLGGRVGWMRDFRFFNPRTDQLVRQLELYYRTGRHLYIFTAEVREDLYRLYLADFRSLYGSIDLRNQENERVPTLDGASVGPPGSTRLETERFKCSSKRESG